MTGTALSKSWNEVRSFADAHLPPGLRDALERMGSERVVHLSVPYGTQLIEDGVFCWDLLGDHQSWSEEYAAPVPVTLVATKSVELYDLVTHISRHSSKQGKPLPPKEVTRSAPLFMTQAGSFFGLFENFADDIGQPPLRATAGGTTLMVLPPIGTSKLLRQFICGLRLSCRKAEAERLAQTLQTNTRSTMAFGPFFAGILKAKKCSWRCDLIVFSPQFVRKICASTKASAAVTKMTLTQMALSHRRANQINAILQRPESEDGARVDHVQSLRFIAAGTRPGFAPVLGREQDEEVLPARELHALLFPPEEDEDRKALDPLRCFPHLLRPSLPGEASFYFLARPYSGMYFREPEAAEERVDRILSALEDDGAAHPGQFWHATAETSADYLTTIADTSRPVKLPAAGSNLLRWGMIGFTPDPSDATSDNC